MNNTGEAFASLEKLLQGAFLLCLFFGKLKYLTPLIGNLNNMPVKKSGLGIQNFVTYMDEKYLRWVFEPAGNFIYITI